MKRIACLAIALILTLGLSFSAFAADAGTHTITITDPDGRVRTAEVPVPTGDAILKGTETTDDVAPVVEPETANDVSPAPAPQNEAFRRYLWAMEKMEGKPIEMVGSMKMLMNMGADSDMEIKTNINIKQLTNAKGEMEMAVVQTSDLINVEQYYKDGWLYNKIGDVKTKQKIDFAALAANNSELGVVDELTAEMFENATVEDLSNGDMRIRLTMTGASMEALVGDTLDSMFGESDSVNIGDIAMYLTLDEDGNFKSQRQLYAVAISVSGINVTATYDTNMTIRSVGALGAIPFPDDLEEYESAAIITNV